MWARQLAEGAGVVVPNQAAEHYYIITGEMPEIDPSWPVIEDPRRHACVCPFYFLLYYSVYRVV